MLWRCLMAMSLLAALGVPALAKPSDRLIQHHVNLTLSCQDMAASMQNLQALCGQLGGIVTNSNLQVEQGSASANLKLPPEQIPAFLAKARGLGDVQNENVSTSDNTRSWEEARNNLELAEKMAAVEWEPRGGNVTPTQKLVFEAEFKSFLRDRINNHRSNLASYEEYRRWADISITLQGQPKPARRPAAVVESVPGDGPPASAPPAAAPEPPASNKPKSAVLLIAPSIFLGVCLAYFVFSRRGERS